MPPTDRIELPDVIAQALRDLRSEIRRATNWWDVLPQESYAGGTIPWERMIGRTMWTFRLQPGSDHPFTQIEIRVTPCEDRLELQLRVDAVIVWQRALFYHPPAADRRE